MTGRGEVIVGIRQTSWEVGISSPRAKAKEALCPRQAVIGAAEAEAATPTATAAVVEALLFLLAAFGPPQAM